MPDHARSLIRRASAAACFVLTVALPAAAQQTPPPPAPDFFSRYDFHLSAVALGADDPRFSWTTRFGGDIDVVDYVSGRLWMRAEYEAVLGDELQPFDPNQGNYTLEVASSARTRGAEVALVFHHVSRHFGDREKKFGIAWNVLGVRALGRMTLKNTAIDLQADMGRVTQHAFVDYRWIGGASALARRRLTTRFGIFARGSSEVVGIDAAAGSRGAQAGGLAEAGIQINGRGGAVELFAGYERRVDAAPLDREPMRWAYAGFRLVGPAR